MMKLNRLFAMLFAMLLLASCNSGTVTETVPTETENNTVETEKLTPLGKLEGLSFNGAPYRIAAMDKMQDDYPNYMAANDMTGELLNDTAYLRNIAVEEMFDVKLDIQFQETDGSGRGTIKAVSQSVLAGEDAWDLIQFSSAHDQVAPLVEQNMLYNILEIPYLTLDASYFYGGINDRFIINDFLPIGFSHYNNSTNEPLYMVFNKDMMTGLGMDYPYDIIFDGDWTWDVFLSYIKGVTADMDGDGKIKYSDRHGYANVEGLTNYLVWGFGIDITERKADSSYAPSLQNEKLIDSFQRVVEFSKNNDDVWRGASDDGTNHIFMGGNVLFSTNGTSKLNLRNIEDFDFGLAPFPKYDEKQTEYLAFTGLNQFSVPTTIQNPEMTGAVLEALSYLSEKDMTPAFLDTYVENKVLRDEESVKVMKLILANPVTDIVRYFNFADISPVYLLSKIKDAGTVVSKIASEEEKATQAAEEFFKIFFDN